MASNEVLVKIQGGHFAMMCAIFDFNRVKVRRRYELKEWNGQAVKSPSPQPSNEELQRGLHMTTFIATWGKAV